MLTNSFEHIIVFTLWLQSLSHGALTHLPHQITAEKTAFSLAFSLLPALHLIAAPSLVPFYPLLLSPPFLLQKRSVQSRNEINLLYYTPASLLLFLFFFLPHLNLILPLLCWEDWTRHFNLFILDMNLLACLSLPLTLPTSVHTQGSACTQKHTRTQKAL